ncbi:family 78 glycoside hydrolase catalytic domain [Flavobacteriaceae bacterium]|nr:family 78 glycoside hydrolase catalytic domain [Flavobacteriaceae bacterium]
MKKTIFLFIVSVISVFNTYAQEPVNKFSKNSSEFAPSVWKAKWIVVPGLSKDDKNSIMLARKEFNLSTLEKTNTIYITADSHYKLWINGKFVSRGPARCNPHHQSYDVMDVSEFLHNGKNSIAVQVHFHGVMKSYYSNPYPGLLVQLEFGSGDAKKYIVSDKSWKMTKDSSWSSKTKWVNPVNANNFASSVNLGGAKAGWYAKDYNTKGWSNAKYQTGPPMFPKKPADYEPYAVQKPWFSLVPRDLPALKEQKTPVFKVFKVTEAAQYSNYDQHWGGKRGHDALTSALHDIQKPIKNSTVNGLQSFIKGKGKLEVVNSYPRTLLERTPVWNTTIVFDYGHVQDGYPYLKIKGAKGAIVDVNYAPYLIDGVFHPSVISENFSDRVILSGKNDVWENTELRTFRYVAVTIRSQDPVVFEEIGIDIEEYPFKENGTIAVSGEPFIQGLWKANEKTLQSITTDAFTDNYQERRQYVQTSFYASLGNYATYADGWLQRRYLVQHAQDQLPNGIMPMWAPWGIYEENNQVPGIFEANHFWLMGLHDYYLYTGDKETVRDLLVNAERCAEAINQVQYQDNLIFKPPYPYWIDWAKLAQGDQNFILNALQLLAFDEYAELLMWLGETEKSNKWYTEAAKIRTALKAFWDTDKGLFAENITNGKTDDSFSEHANALAIVAGVADVKQTELVLAKILKNDVSRTMEESALFNYWVSKAICESGRTKEAVTFLKKRYQHMLAKGENGTLWEYSNLHAQLKSKPHSEARNLWKGRSWCTAQGENCFPGIILSEYVLGLKAVAPGVKHFELNTFNSPYKKVSGSLPTPNGLVKVNKNGNRINIIIPKGISALISKETLLAQGVKTITIDGKLQELNSFKDYQLITSGNHTINYTK